MYEFAHNFLHDSTTFVFTLIVAFAMFVCSVVIAYAIYENYKS